MSFTAEFDRYLGLFRLRLKQLAMARGTAAASVAALVITVIFVTLAIRNGFPGDIVVTGRLLLFGSIAALVWLLVVRPGRELADGGAEVIETRTPEFGGRVETYLEMQETGNPLREFLAEDTLKIAAGAPPEQQVPQREFTYLLSAAGIAMLGLLVLGIAGPGNYSYGVRHLWFGWALPGLLPPQSIEVAPGDDGIRLGGKVNVRATMEGFAPADAYVHARFGDGEWQQVAMTDAGDGFEFTFFSVRDELEYFVSAANVRSPAYTISVVDLPVVENLATTYRYPEWTKLEEETRDPGGDVRAVIDTEVEVRIATDRPMTAGELVVDDQVVELEVDGDGASATFTVTGDGQYFIAARVGGEQIRLTDDYFISLQEDEGPQIEFARPGRDWSASSVEEVTAMIRADDDFGLEGLELRYSVNGSDWESVELPVAGNAGEAEHVFFLESLSQIEPQGTLRPGDLISYYAVARDRENSSSTDIFFIDVQPFDRRYSQSQQMGGMSGQQGGQQQNEISQRQREIIVSTWNLIREHEEKQASDPAYISDNAAMLSRVQATLRAQVETLSQRTQARQLDASADEIAEFVDNLNKASAAMIPAAERLGELELEQAILPEQEALQHLLAAEAVFTDISVSLQANNRGGGGGQAGRDLTEMFELEMDLEKNQYETGSNAMPDPPEQQLEEAANELEELARRQEQLARNIDRNRQPTPAQRWQQEMLRRDVEELRERLEQMQQQQAASQSQSNSSQSNSSQSDSSQGSEQQSAAQSSSAEAPESRQSDELQRRLDSAVRAMNEADEAMRAGADPEDMRRAADEAQRQLEGARDRALQDREESIRASLNELSERASDLHGEQAAMDRRIQEALRGVSVGRNSMNRLDSGMSIDEEYEMAARKRELQSELQRLRSDARNAASQIEDGRPQVAEELRDALERLDDLDVESRISVAADFIEQGDAVYVAASESAVTDALRQLSEDIERAERMAERDGNTGRETGNGRSVAQTLEDTRQLRRELQRAADSTRQQGGALSRSGDDNRPESSGEFVDDLTVVQDFDRRADNISQDVLNMFRQLREAGVSIEEIDDLRQRAADLRAADFSGNPELLEREARNALALAEQLEMALARTAAQEAGQIRTRGSDEVPDEHREIIADYYRRLGRADDETDQ